jgi:hypothetical protein
MNDQRRFAIRESLVVREEEDGAFLFDPVTGDLKYANAAAKEIFLMLKDEKGVTEIVQQMIRQYPDVPEDRIRQDVNGLIESLTAEGFLILHKAGNDSVEDNL